MAHTQHAYPFEATLSAIWSALDGGAVLPQSVQMRGSGSLPSVYPVSDLAVASIAAAGLGIAERLTLAGIGATGPIVIDRALASHWFSTSCRAEGWTPPSPWDPVAGDYQTSDGWIRLHTNAPHHRAAALAVLGAPAERQAVADAVIRWSSEALETAVVENGGCAAAMRSAAAWATHPQGRAVSQEPLVHQLGGGASGRPVAPISPARPLAGIRVLDLTRVLAGPVATRFLAGYGAEVLRIDPLDWDEPGVLPDVTLGKRRARLDLRSREGRDVFAGLLAGADLLIHGYRADALERLGLGTDRRQAIRPGLIDVSLDAYGWTGPWAQRRGFDSLVQMSAGFAEAGMRHYRTDRPKPLPVQALDHATGYILAAAALRGLNRRAATGEGSVWRTSLARVAGLLATMPAAVDDAPLAPVSEGHYQPELEQTAWGPLSRLRPPLEITGADMRWDRPAGPLGSDAPRWM